MNLEILTCTLLVVLCWSCNTDQKTDDELEVAAVIGEVKNPGNLENETLRYLPEFLYSRCFEIKFILHNFFEKSL